MVLIWKSIAASFCGVEESPIRALRDGLAGQFPYSGSVSGGLATEYDGSTSRRAGRFRFPHR